MKSDRGRWRSSVAQSQGGFILEWKPESEEMVVHSKMEIERPRIREMKQLNCRKQFCLFGEEIGAPDHLKAERETPLFVLRVIFILLSLFYPVQP